MNLNNLISEVFVRPTLWDQKDKYHHNRFVLDKLWDEVAVQLNTARLTVRSKWKSLRDKFRSILVSLPKSKSGDPLLADYKGQWQYFQSLLFLKEQFAPKSSEVDFSTIDEDILAPSQHLQEEKYANETSDKTARLPSEECPDSVTPSSSRPPSSTGSHINRKRKQPAAEDVSHASLEVERKIRQYLEENRSLKEEDDDLNFFKSLLPYVQTLSAYDKMDYRMKILKLTQDFLKPRHPATKMFNDTNL